ncbi:MAG TPA: SGNH/GDSL hydrolase family protein [Vicinamibacterales bacterium]
MNFKSWVVTVAVVTVLAVCDVNLRAQAPVRFVGMGDSIGEGVQSGDANAVTQNYSFLHLMARQFGASFPLPLIRTNLFASVGETSGRSRFDLTVQTLNLSVSGANSTSILFDAATAADPSQIDSETELVLFPQLGSQIEIAERLQPEYIACWIGSNDALSAALAFDQLNATQLTPLPIFTANFTQLVQRIAATGTKAVFGTIPDITGIGFLLNRDELVRFLGSDYGLPADARVGLPAMFMVRLGVLPTTIFSDPNYVLDSNEQQIISNHIRQLNEVIYATATAHGMAVADLHGVFQYLSTNGLNLFGINLSTRFLGGLFSLDGVHPSNIGHGVAALFFIDALNQKYGAGIPLLDGGTLAFLTLTDPFIDKDGDGRVLGRFGGGLIETVFSVLGISGDTSDPLPSPTTMTSTSDAATTSSTTAQREQALDEIKKLTGLDWRKVPRGQLLRAVHEMFGTSRLAR